MSHSLRKLIKRFESKKINNSVEIQSSSSSLNAEAQVPSLSSPLKQSNSRSKAADFFPIVEQMKSGINFDSSATPINSSRSSTRSNFYRIPQQLPLTKITSPVLSQNLIQQFLPSSNGSNLPFNILETSRKLRSLTDQSIKESTSIESQPLEPMDDLLFDDSDDIDGSPISPETSSLEEQDLWQDDAPKSSSISLEVAKLDLPNEFDLDDIDGLPISPASSTLTEQEYNLVTSDQDILLPFTVTSLSSTTPTDLAVERSEPTTTNAVPIDPEINLVAHSNEVIEEDEIEGKPKISIDRPERATKDWIVGTIETESNSYEESMRSRPTRSSISKLKKKINKSSPILPPQPVIDSSEDLISPEEDSAKDIIKVDNVKSEIKKLKSLPITKPFIPPLNFSFAQIYKLRRPQRSNLPTQWFCSFCDQTCDPQLRIRNRKYGRPFKYLQVINPVSVKIVGEHIKVCEKLEDWKETLEKLWIGLIENSDDIVRNGRSSRSGLTNSASVTDSSDKKRKFKNGKDRKGHSKKIKVKDESIE